MEINLESDKLHVLIDERGGMRTAIQVIEKIQHSTVFVALTIIGTNIGIIFGGDIILESNAIGIVVLILLLIIRETFVDFWRRMYSSKPKTKFLFIHRAKLYYLRKLKGKAARLREEK